MYTYKQITTARPPTVLPGREYISCISGVIWREWSWHYVIFGSVTWDAAVVVDERMGGEEESKIRGSALTHLEWSILITYAPPHMFGIVFVTHYFVPTVATVVTLSRPFCVYQRLHHLNLKRLIITIKRPCDVSGNAFMCDIGATVAQKWSHNSIGYTVCGLFHL